jgi:hypothetical protein
MYGVTRERIRQIISKALVKIGNLGTEWLALIEEQLEGEIAIGYTLTPSDFGQYLIIEVMEQKDLYYYSDLNVISKMKRSEMDEFEQVVRKELTAEWKGKTFTADESQEYANVLAEKHSTSDHFVLAVLQKFIQPTENGKFILTHFSKADIAEIILRNHPDGVEIYKNAKELCEEGNNIIPGTFLSDRDLTAIFSRDEFSHIGYLWGRGKYIHHSFVKVPFALLNEIVEKIKLVLEDQILVSVGKIFHFYQDQLHNSHIPNEYALYELLRTHAGDEELEFPKYPRITKSGEKLGENADLIKNYIRQRGKPVPTSELRKQFVERHGWKYFTLDWNLSTSNEFIQYDFGVNTLLEFYNHISKEDLQPVVRSIERSLRSNPAIQVRGAFFEHESYCKSIGIETNVLLYSLLRDRYQDEFLFPRYPHITRADVNTGNLSMKNLIENYILDQGCEVPREEVYTWVTEEVGGRVNTLDTVLLISDDIFYYSRGQFGEYIHRDIIGWNEEKQEQLRAFTSKMLKDEIERTNKPFLLVDKCLQEDKLPTLEIDLPWTVDLLIDCLRRDPLFIQLGSYDRIILFAENEEHIHSNADFVAFVLKKDLNGAAKLSDVKEQLKKYAYSSDGDLLHEIKVRLQEGNAPFEQVGDELILKSLYPSR